MKSIKKTHILIIPSWYPKTPTDIGGSFFREQAIALKSAGFNVGVIFPQIRSLKNAFKGFNGLQKEVDNDVVTYRNGYVNFYPRCKELIQQKWLKCGEKLFKLYIKENGKPDIIHAHSLFNGGLLAYFLSEKYNIPFVITEHSTAFSRKLLSYKQLDDARIAVQSASACIAVSNEFKTLLNEQLKTDKWDYIPNIVSNSFLKSKFVDKKNNNKTYRFINICLLEPKKKVDLLIRAFHILSEQIDDIELEIGGDGPEFNYLINLAKELNLLNKIKFHGKLTRLDVLEKVSEADAFVLSSEFETFGVVLVEALALGKPVIATKCGGPESIVISDVGYLVEKNSSEALAEAMLKMHANRDAFKPNSIRSYCRQEFSEESVISRLTYTYNQVLNYYE